METTYSPSSAFPYEQQQSQQALPNPAEGVSSSSSSTSSGSIGPFFAVISVLTFLAIVSCFIGRICKGRRSTVPLGSIKHGGLFEWLRRKCCLCASNDDRVLGNKATAGQIESNDAKAVAPDAV